MNVVFVAAIIVLVIGTAFIAGIALLDDEMDATDYKFYDEEE